MGKVLEFRRARFSVGDLIRHRLFGYRGVVVDVDLKFQASEEWYAAVARSRPPRDKPWYHVLVDGATHMTYVAERNLDRDDVAEEIRHPMVGYYFSSFDGSRYLPGRQRQH